MKLFTCGVCGQALMFENTRCERCKHRLGYHTGANALLALEPQGDAWRTAEGVAPSGSWRFCANASHDVCNWIVDDGESPFCRACRHNHTTPNLDHPANGKVLYLAQVVAGGGFDDEASAGTGMFELDIER